jgi:hypothetical protein
MLTFVISPPRLLFHLFIYTVAPSDDPSDSPSHLPTPIPGGSGTVMPSAANATVAPSDPPSDEPSVAGGNGTAAPSPKPAPTAEPTTKATPTLKPTTGATLESPTLSPIRGKPITETFTGVTMTLKGVGAMDVSSILNWKTTTQEFYIGLYNPNGDTGGDGKDSNILVGLRNLRVHHHDHLRRLQKMQGVENFKTNITYRGDAATGTDNTLRYDQTITYDQTTTENAPTAQELVQDPFKNDDLNREYTADLRRSDPLFSQLQEGVVVTAPSPTPTPGPDNIETPSEVNGGLSPGAIAGIVLGCVAVVGIAGYFIAGGSKSGDGHGGSTGDYLPTTNEPPQTLSMDQGEEVSTMQDPVLGPPHLQGSSVGGPGEFGDQR